MWRPTVTDVARSVVCVSVCLSVRWSRGCAVQIRMNRSRRPFFSFHRIRSDESISSAPARGDKSAMRILKVTGNHVHRKCGSMSEAVQDRIVVTIYH